jgi:multidrug efflux pump subunit AcrB
MSSSEFSVKNYQFTLVVFVALFSLGMFSLFNMPRSEDPVFNAPQFFLIAVYPGTSPKDMERSSVVDPIEKKVNELDDIKKVVSTIDDGVAVIGVYYKYESNVDSKYQELVREVNALKKDLPQDLYSLEIMKSSSSG